ncbi:hypothetical protein C8R43DRAFT_1130463 [Mycena crocata]|nr:hypothetical protein C8R43DRAFT_1130463 [Mycena crocata]
MPPPGWTTPDEFAFLHRKIAEYITKKAEGRLWKFWPAFFEDWFNRFSEEARMVLISVVKTKEQVEGVGKAVGIRKGQLVSWLRYHSKKVNTAPVATVQAQDSLANDLFKKKAPHRRAHRTVELFQKRNHALVDAALEVAGFFELNEAHAAATLAGWAEESAEDQKARMKTAQVERMTIRTRVVDELFSEASDDELRCIDELIKEEERVLALVNKGSKKGLKEQARQDRQEAEDPAREPTLEQYQLAIDESPEVMARIHKVLARKTGWYGITIYGGSNLRFGGGLSMKTVCFGRTLAGNDFEAAHGSFDESISKHFQAFLKRSFCKYWRWIEHEDVSSKSGCVVCFGRTLAGNDFEAAHGSFDESISKHFQAFLKRSFSTKVRRARALQQLAETVDDTLPSLDGLFRLPDEAKAATHPLREKPKCVRKKKPKTAAASSAPAAAAQPVSISSPATSHVLSSPDPLPNSSPPSNAVTPYVLHAADADSFSTNNFDDGLDNTDNFQCNFGNDGLDTTGTDSLGNSPRDGAENECSAQPWLAGMGPPSSPATAQAAANLKRGGLRNAIYMTAARGSPPIDPSLLDNPLERYTRPSVGVPRPAWKNVAAPISPTPTSTVLGFNFPGNTTSTPSRMPLRLNSLVNRFHHIMGDPPVVTATPGRSSSASVAVNTMTGRPDVANPFSVGTDTVSPNSPARISRISSTAAGVSKAVEPTDHGSNETAAATGASEMVESAAQGSSERGPFKIWSPPMANDPTATKASVAASARGASGKHRKAVIATDAATKEIAVKEAAKGAAKKGKAKGKSMTATGRGGDVAALEDTTNLDGEQEPLPVAAAGPTLIFTMTNNSAPYAKVARKLEAEKKVREAAEKKERARLHNPDTATRNFDGSEVVPLPKKLTWAQQQAKKNEVSENALLARTGRKCGAEEEIPAGTSRTSKKSKK